MIYLIVIGIISIFIIINVILIVYYKNKYAFLYIKVNEADNNLDIILEKEQEILVKITDNLEKQNITDLPDVIQLKAKKWDHHSLYNQLLDISNSLIKTIEDDDEKIMNSTLQRLLDLLEDNENDLRAAIKYYNDNATDINYYAHKFPSNIVKHFCHYQDVELYRIKRREKFAILKSS